MNEDIAELRPKDARQKILDLIGAGDVAAAQSALAQAHARRPDDEALQLAGGDMLLQAGHPVAAADQFATVFGRGGPEPDRSARRLLRLLADHVLPADDVQRLALRLATAPQPAAAKLPLLEKLLQRDDPHDAAALLEAVAPVAGVFRLEWRQAVKLTEQGRVAQALHLLESARTAGRSSPQSLLLEAELLPLLGRDADAAQRVDAILAQHADQPDVYRRCLAVLQRANAHEAAARHMAEAVRRWPGDWMLVYRLNRLVLSPEAVRALHDALAPGAAQACIDNDRYRLQYAQSCLHVGEHAEAARLLAQPFEEPSATLATPLALALSARPLDFWRTMPRQAFDRREDVTVVRAPGAAPATIVVTGTDAFGYMPMHMVDALLAEQGCHAIYLKDFRKRAFLRGVAGLGEDEAATVEALRRLLAELGAPRTVFLGSSMGGFAAFRYAALLGAHAALSFGGPVDLRAALGATQPVIWNPTYFLKCLLDQDPSLPTDLRPVVEAARGTRFHHVHAALHTEDGRQAALLQGLPHVHLQSVPGVKDHLVVDHCIANGSFAALLQQAAQGGR